jgi:hypothetical protein
MTDVYQSVRAQATRKRIERAMRNPNIADKSLIDEDFVDRDDYGVMSNQLRGVLRDLRDLPCHLVITALERVDDDGTVGPAISPALAHDVLGYADLTLRFRATLHATGEDEDQALAEFRALTRPGARTRAKDRFDMTPRVLVEPTFPRILGYVRGEIQEDADPIQAAYVRRRAEEAAAAAAEAEQTGAKQEGPARKPRTRKTTKPSESDRDADDPAHANGE